MTNFATGFFFLSLDSSFDPLDPSRDEAQTWATQELSKAIYNQSDTTILDNILNWLDKLFSSVRIGAGGINISVPTFITIVCFFMFVVFIVLLTSGKLSLNKPKKNSENIYSPIFDEEKTRDQYLKAAQVALEANDFSLAFIQSFRAWVLGLEEHGILQVYPGLTALEVCELYSKTGSKNSEQSKWACQLFNSLRFGQAESSAQDCQRLKDLDLSPQDLVSRWPK